MDLPEHLRRLLASAALAVAGAISLTAVGGTPLTPVVTGPTAPAAAEVLSARTAADPRPVVPALRPAAAVAPVVPQAVARLVAAQRAAGLDCTVVTGAVPVCVHGHDEAPSPAAVAAAGPQGATPRSGSIGCYGDGTSGPRVRAVYARPEGSADRYASSATSIRQWAAGVSRQVDESAKRTGGRRHVRFATTAGSSCSVTVVHAVLPHSAFRSFEATVDALAARGLTAARSKYLVWADVAVMCGTATMYVDDTPGPDNLNDGSFASYARVDRPCWGYAEAHELVHMLGGVQPSAPHATAGYHCNDGHDVLCYDDGTRGSRQRTVCAAGSIPLLDCRSDDYFSTAPPRGSYLGTHWNTARSAFFAPALTSPPPPPPTASPKPAAPRPTPTASPSPGPVSAVLSVIPALPAPPALPAVPSLRTPVQLPTVPGSPR